MKKNLLAAYAMKKKMAQGGLVEQGMDYEEDEKAKSNPGSGMGYDIPHPDDSVESHQPDPFDGIVEKIMMQRYSKGGMVANGGDDDLSQMADGKPNNFDDLALRDTLESKNSGEADGDFLSDDQEDKDRGDMIAQILKSRAKKDRNPRPA